MPTKLSAPVKNRTASTPQPESAAPPQVGLSRARLSTADIAQAALADPQSVSPRALLRLQGAVGNRAVTRLVSGPAPAIQAKLTVGAADDPYEREADRVAVQVTSSVARMAEEQPAAQRRAPRGFDNKLRRAETPAQDLRGSFDAGQAVEERIAASSGGGSPLPAAVRSFMEPRFGSDFSSVRVHAGGESAQLNRQLGAKAFTHRNHVYLGDGASAGDRGLMAHELTHVVQQGAAQPNTIQTKPLAVRSIQRFSIDDPNPNFAGASSITMSASGQSGVYFFHDGGEFTPQTLVVKPSDDPVAETMAMTALQGKIGGGKVPKTVDGTRHKTSIRNAIEHNMDWKKAYDKKVQQMNAEGDAFNADDPIVGNKDRFKAAKLQAFDSSPTVFLMGMVMGKEFRDIAKADVNRTKRLMSDPIYMANLGKATAVDIFLGNFDRMLSGNLGNWMSDAQNKIHLIDNIDQGTLGDITKANTQGTSKEYWKQQYEMLSDARIENTAIRGIRALFKTLNIDSPTAGWGQFISKPERESAKTPGKMVAKQPTEITRSDLTPAEKFVMKPFKQGLIAGKKKIMSALAPRAGRRSRSLKREVVGTAGGASWDELKERARWLK